MSTRAIAVYLRVSTTSQDLENQEPELKSWLEANGRDRPVMWFRDTFTGKTMKRPGMRRLERAVRRGRVGSVVVWSTDRLGRTARELQAFLDELDDRGIEFVALRQGGRLDGSTAAGRMFRHMLIGFAEYEREIIGERTRAGMERARAAGKKIGGRKKGHRTRLTPARLKAIGTLLNAGTSKAEIARQLGVSERSVYRAVKLLQTSPMV